MQEKNIDSKKNISLEMIMLNILKKKNLINGQTYEHVYKLYQKMMKGVT